jgi:hypothetical protein
MTSASTLSIAPLESEAATADGRWRTCYASNWRDTRTERRIEDA